MNKEEKLLKAIDLLKQIQEKSQTDDKIEGSENSDIALDGEGWITYHLGLTIELLEGINDAETKE
jgi:hypothetical protein